jgi:DNA-binding LacI/PurR family transcriptional regulator
MTGMIDLVRRGRISVPRDLSIVHFDQNPDVPQWIGAKTTTVAIPLREMGRTLAKLARQISEGQQVASETTLPCELVIGDSVKKSEAR